MSGDHAMKTSVKSKSTSVAIAALTSLWIAAPAAAHPHVFVSVKNAVVFDQDSVTGIEQAWTFDDAYTAGAIEGLDKNKDGAYTRAELQDLAQVNIDGLKEFDYFTYANQNGTPLKFMPPKDYWLDYSNNVLTLHLTTPLEKPLPLKASTFTYSVSDPSFFIAFDFAKDEPIKTAGTVAAGCKAALKVLPADAQTTDLSSAFGVAAEGSGMVDVSCIQ
jgi:ABC-type uncharacterized transport system substrate-binding protein